MSAGRPRGRTPARWPERRGSRRSGRPLRAARRARPRAELSADGDRIARLRNYFYTPEIVAELCGELDLPCRTNGTFRARSAT
jgi:hypothetical protein